MSFPIPVCAACGEAVFPPRVLCPRCGGREWREEDVDRATVERTTEREGTQIATVRTSLGPRIIARLLGIAAAGDEVSLTADGDVPVATPVG